MRRRLRDETTCSDVRWPVVAIAENRASTFEAIRKLHRRSDEDATRALVTLLEDEDEAIALEAARAVHPRSVPPDLRARVGALLAATPAEYHLTRWLYSCAAKAVLEEPPERAFATLAPLLEEHALETNAGRIRAEKILGEIEEKLASSWRAKAARVPDYRFLAVCESLSTRASTEELRDLASFVRGAFLVLEGRAPTPSPRNVELGEGDNPPFPFFVAGFPLPNGTAPRIAESIPGLFLFGHQYGGHACRQDAFLGFAVAPPSAIIASDSLRRLREASFGSRGDSFTESELDDWHEALRGFPPFERGAEALLVSHECEPLAALRGFDVLAFGAPWRTDIDLTVTPDVTTTGVYGDAHDAALLALGLGRPRIVYLWGNSD